MMSPSRSLPVAACLAVSLFGMWLHAGQSPPPLPDFSSARNETVQVLQNLIRIDTSNPPGNETRAATYIKTLLDRERIA
jgi:hypothetical protein